MKNLEKLRRNVTENVSFEFSRYKNGKWSDFESLNPQMIFDQKKKIFEFSRQKYKSNF